MGFAALGRIAAAVAPTAAVLVFLLSAVASWQHVSPTGFPRLDEGVEGALIRAQVERARSIPKHVDVLLVGDSSCLMGIDAELLGELLGGARVESLCAVGHVGPRGYAALLRGFADRGGTAARVLVVLHPSTLVHRPHWRRIEAIALQEPAAPEPPDGLVAGLRARLARVAAEFLPLPLPRFWGDYYGSTERFAEYLRAHHGSAVDPRRPLPADPPDLSFLASQPQPAAPPEVTIQSSFSAALPPLVEAVASLGRERTRLVLMPQVDWLDLADSRADASRRLRVALGIESSPDLGTPDHLPGPWFGSPSHLTPAARERFTRILADSLAADRARQPWPSDAKAPASASAATSKE